MNENIDETNENINEEAIDEAYEKKNEAKKLVVFFFFRFLIHNLLIFLCEFAFLVFCRLRQKNLNNFCMT